MPIEHSQQKDAARASVRVRTTNKLVRLLYTAPPLTAAQRAAVVAAAVAIRPLEESR